jgi:DNA polymerase-3 subunit epsilon
VKGVIIWTRPLGLRWRRLRRLAFAVVDLETTGWSPGSAGITEIAAVRVRGGRIEAEFATLVNPGQPIPADITELTGISDAMVAGAPPAAAVLPAFLRFTRGCVLTAHNAPFDVGFLTAACAASGRRWRRPPVLDTVTLARLALADGEVPNCKLSTLAAFFGAADEPRHRALADARATAAVLTGLLGQLAERGVRRYGPLAAAQAGLAAQAASQPPRPAGPGGPEPAAGQRYATRQGCTEGPAGGSR